MFFSFVPSGYRRWQWPPRQSDINLNAAQMLRRKFSPSDSRFYQPRRESKHELMQQPRRESKHELMQQPCKANAKREAKMSTRLALHFLQHMDEWSFTNFCASVPHCLAKSYLNVIQGFRCCDALSCLRILALHSQDLCHSGTSMLQRGYLFSTNVGGCKVCRNPAFARCIRGGVFSQRSLSSSNQDLLHIQISLFSDQLYFASKLVSI
jgi:hypothetical protein